MMDQNPYRSLGEKHFWAPAVAQRNMFDISDLWEPKFPLLPRMPVATYGSCFAQHLGRALQARGYKWVITERAPRGLSLDNARRFNYGIFSARTGNIYTTSLLRQWVSWATGEATVPEELWEHEGRFYDPFRPVVEPNGFESAEELIRSRTACIDAFRDSIRRSRVLIYTLGLTESWFNAEKGYEYPMCPGTSAGVFNPAKHRFVNQQYPEILQELTTALLAMKQINRGLRVILTVSPVPLTATMSGNHVLVATTESKSILRAVAGQLKTRYPFVDYFPSYEIINAPPFRGAFFEPNQRSVNPVGVEHVMKQFFRTFEVVAEEKIPLRAEHTEGVQTNLEARRREDVVCEEELLSAFGSG